MIDKSGKYQAGESSEDINEYLREYSDNNEIDVKPVMCHNCGSDELNIRVDYDAEVIQLKCPICGSKEYNIKIEFSRRENKSGN